MGRLNPDWNEECDDGDLDAKFQEAMELAGTEFEEQVNWLSEVLLMIIDQRSWYKNLPACVWPITLQGLNVNCRNVTAQLPNYKSLMYRPEQVPFGEFNMRFDCQVWLPARTVVEDAIKKAKETDSSGEIIVLESGCPWKEHLYDLEKELGVEKPLKYVVYGVSTCYSCLPGPMAQLKSHSPI